MEAGATSVLLIGLRSRSGIKFICQGMTWTGSGGLESLLAPFKTFPNKVAQNLSKNTTSREIYPFQTNCCL